MFPWAKKSLKSWTIQNFIPLSSRCGSNVPERSYLVPLWKDLDTLHCSINVNFMQCAPIKPTESKASHHWPGTFGLHHIITSLPRPGNALHKATTCRTIYTLLLFLYIYLREDRARRTRFGSSCNLGVTRSKPFVWKWRGNM